MPLNLRHLTLLLLIALTFACRRSGENLPEPNYNPHALKPGNYIEARPRVIPLDSLPQPIYVPAKGTYVKAGKPTYVPADDNYVPAGRPKYTPTQGKVIEMDSSFQLEFVPAKGKRVPSSWPKWQAGRPPSRIDGLYPLYYMGEENGLNDHTIWCLLEDRKGRIWIGTQNGGLSVWDGVGFIHFTIKEGLTSNCIYSILEDRHGNIWIGTSNGVCVWDGEGFTQFTDAEGLTTRNAHSLQEDQNENIWIGGWGVNIWNGSGFAQFKGTAISQLGLVWDIKEDQEGNIWMGGLGVSVWDGRRFTRFTDAEGLSGNFIRSFLEDKQRKLWIGTWGAGVNIWDGSGITNFPGYAGLSEDAVWNLMEDKDGRIWMGGQAEGINIWDGQGFTNYTRKEKLSDNFVRCFLQDRFGRIWIGTNDGGVMIWDNTQPAHYTQAAGLTNDLAVSLLADPTGQMRMGIHESSLNIWDGEGFTQAKIPGLLNDEAPVLYRDRKDNIWIGSRDLSIWDEQGFTHFSQKELKVVDAVGTQAVVTMAEDKQGKIWVGCTFGGLRNWDGDGFTYFPQIDTSYNTNCIYSLLTDRQDNIWLGTRDGICVWNGHAFIHYQSTIGQGSPICALLEDKKGNIWIGTWYDGLIKWDGSGFTNYTKEEGLSSNSIKSLFYDEASNIWVGTRGGGGLMRIYEDNTGLAVEHFSTPSGLEGRSYMAINADQDKKLWLATSKGVDVMSIPSDTTSSTVYLREIQPFFDRIDWRQLQDTVQKGGEPTTGETEVPLAKVTYDSVYRFTNLPAAPRFPYNINQLTLHWNGLNALQPTQLQYSYLLEGRERSWSPPMRENQITFQDLRPGKYTFQVRAVSGTGRWSDTATYAFTIRPPWFWAWWSQSLYVLLLLGGGYSLYRFQLNRRLDQAETARLQEMDEVKTRLFTNITHEFRTPLTVVLGMEEKIRQDPSRRLSESLQMIRRNGHVLLRLVNQLLGLARLESNALPLHLVQADIIPYLQYIVASFGSYAETKGIRLHFQSETESLVMDYDPDIVLQIVSNLLSNAIKFTAAGGDIHLAAKIREFNLLELRVQDNGVGIPAEKLPYIFDRFYQASFSPSNGREEKAYTREGVGIGLALTRELVRLLGGQIKVESTVGKGTEFTLRLPIRRDAAPAVGAPGAREKVKEELLAFMVPDQPEPDDLAVAPAATPADAPLILIVEDNADVSKYLIACLEGEYQIETAADGRAGIDKALEIVPDLIISDVMMPEKDGFELCYALKNDLSTSHIPIVLLTARADIDSKIAGLRQGADAYLAKPFYEEELKAQLVNLLALRRKLQTYYSSPDYLNGQAPKGSYPAESLEDEFLRQIRQAIEANLDDYHLDVTKLCRALGVSRTVLHNKLKALTGQSTTEYMRFIRLHKSCALLRDTKLNISQIAFEIGFQNPTYFTKMFGELFGCSPSEYRGRGGK